jgi:hypothetical protein
MQRSIYLNHEATPYYERLMYYLAKGKIKLSKEAKRDLLIRKVSSLSKLIDVLVYEKVKELDKDVV